MRRAYPPPNPPSESAPSGPGRGGRDGRALTVHATAGQRLDTGPGRGRERRPGPLAQRGVQTRVTVIPDVFRRAQLTPTIGSLSAPGASTGTTGAAGGTGSIRRYAAPSP